MLSSVLSDAILDVFFCHCLCLLKYYCEGSKLAESSSIYWCCGSCRFLVLKL